MTHVKDITRPFFVYCNLVVIQPKMSKFGYESQKYKFAFDFEPKVDLKYKSDENVRLVLCEAQLSAFISKYVM